MFGVLLQGLKKGITRLAYILQKEDSVVEVADKLVPVVVVLAHTGTVEEVLKSPAGTCKLAVLCRSFKEDSGESRDGLEGDALPLLRSLQRKEKHG